MPVAAALVGPNYDQLLVWSAYMPDAFLATANVGQTYTALLDLSAPNNEPSAVVVSNTNHDMFCPGASQHFRLHLTPHPDFNNMFS